MATFTFQQQNPSPDAVQVRPTVPITGIIRLSDPILTAEFRINGELAVATQGFEKIVWARPNYAGHVRYFAAAGLLAFEIQHRRHFSPDTTYVVEVKMAFFDGDALSEQSVRYQFTTDARETPLTTEIAAQDYLDTGFETPALNTLRHLLVGALRSETSTLPARVLFYNRVSRSSLASAVPVTADYVNALAQIVPTDIQSVVVADAVLSSARPFWEGALSEAGNTGLRQPTIALLESAMASPSPQERVGAACALMLLAPPPAGFTA